MKQHHDAGQDDIAAPRTLKKNFTGRCRSSSNVGTPGDGMCGWSCWRLQRLMRAARTGVSRCLAGGFLIKAEDLGEVTWVGAVVEGFGEVVTEGTSESDRSTAPLKTASASAPIYRPNSTTPNGSGTGWLATIRRSIQSHRRSPDPAGPAKQLNPARAPSSSPQQMTARFRREFFTNTEVSSCRVQRAEIGLEAPDPGRIRGSRS
jgi:hypothetical protein